MEVLEHRQPEQRQPLLILPGTAQPVRRLLHGLIAMRRLKLHGSLWRREMRSPSTPFTAIARRPGRSRICPSG